MSTAKKKTRPAKVGRKREEFVAWDTAEHLKSPEEIAIYLADMIEEGGDDPRLINVALSTAARAYGILKLSKATGISRPGLYKALSAEGNPSFDTVLKITRALGVKLTAEAA